MIRCYITDRRSAGGDAGVLDAVRRAAEAGVDYIQVREKDMEARALLDLVERVVAIARPFPTRVLVNSRADVALAAGAAGVHLPANPIALKNWRAITPGGFLIGVSCHTLDEVKRTESEGADYVLFGPVFATGSKPLAKPVGLELLGEAARSVKIPVLALGGVAAGNAGSCVEAGAAGIAGISMFQAHPVELTS